MECLHDWTEELGLKILVDRRNQYWAEIELTGERVALIAENRQILEVYLVAFSGKPLSDVPLKQAIYWGFLRSLITKEPMK
ncbi:MAG TPA: hypothetical protein DDW52_13455 [Planctomycetaceae bacterium]|nr:hypothetical protein [Planctomycetaceae bacterium]